MRSMRWVRLGRSLGLLACTLAAATSLAAQQPDTAPPPVPVADSGSAAPASAADADLITRTLVSRGFANVATVVEGRRVFVTFENTRYRDLRRALHEVAAGLLPGADELVLVPSVDGVPLGTAWYGIEPGGNSAPASSSHQTDARPRTSLSVAGLPPRLLSAHKASSSYGRVDVVVHPWFEASFGDYDEPVRSRTGVAPEVRIALRRGLRLSAQVLFTLQDDLPTGESRVRPALLTLSQTVRLPRNVFVHAAAGAFTPNRYGADVQARAYSPSGRWFAGAELAQTGVVSYAENDWRRSPVEDRTALVEAGWRLLPTGLVVQATAGSFLGDQRGVRLDVVRQFGEVDFGGFVMTGEQGKNGGAILRIPIGPRRHPAPRPLRLRTADAFRWEYRYYGFVPGGRRFRTGNPLDDIGRWIDFAHHSH
ncbi:MAG TPA: YjbH domain-containing protein [Longimicrobium sp.]|nr:YjbH domain-containing protein [Longimicrobium sp.]